MDIVFVNHDVTEVHLKGCKAATRRKGYFDAILRESTLDVLIEMRKNPDEGETKVHGCLAKAAKAAGIEIPEQAYV